MSLPTCPREDCTFTGPHHDHYKTTGEVRDRSKESDCVCDASTPNYTRCYAPRTPQPQPAAVVLPTVGRDDVRKGDRLRVVATWDGVLSEVYPDALYIRQDDGSMAFWDPNDDETVTYLLHRPEPEDPRVAVVKEWLNNTREGPADLLARLDAMGADA